jgi:cobalt-zinc-cadmium efflux system membrane fusion protein
MKKIFLYSLLLCLPQAFLFTACKNKEKTNNAEGAAGTEKTTDSLKVPEVRVNRLVEISEQKFKNSGIGLGTVEDRNLKDIVKCNGILTLPPQNKANISSLVSGTVKNVFVIEGDLVKKGKVLSSLLSTQAIQMQEEYIKTKDNLGFLEQEYQRQKELLDQNVTSGKKYQQAEAAYKSEKGRMNSLRDQLISIGLSPTQVGEGNTTSLVPVIAPIDGYVRKIDINIGTFVEAAREMFEIVDLHHIHIDLQAFESDYSKIKIGQKVFFTLPNQADGSIEAIIFATGKAFENDSRSVTIHAEIKNNKNKTLIPGMYVNAFIETGAHKVPSLPADAVISNAGKQYIFILKEEKKAGEAMVYLFEIKEVKTGVIEEGYIEIIPLEDLPENSKVVTKGAYFLASEMKKGEGGDDE